MKFDITVDGHAASVTFTEDGKGTFSGTIDTTEFGSGTVSGSADGNNLSGKAQLDGYTVNLAAAITGNTISGTLSHIFMETKSFTGTSV